MIDLIDTQALDDLVASRTPRETFGPGTHRPYLTLVLDGVDDVHEAWISDLPCPVIGIGEGSLANACDLIMPDITGIDHILNNIKKAPIASMVLVQHLRISEKLNLKGTLTAESFAYATLQKGPEFQDWLTGFTPARTSLNTAGQPLDIVGDGGEIKLVLNDPDNFNPIGVRMRDALCEILDLALADEGYAKISITGAGRAFSTGGEIREFGEISDPATAHWVRSLRLPAWRLARLQNRLHVHVNGAAIGAGAEIAAFGKRVTASPDAWFQLPELKYGLIPGAGGTASLPPRIGRQRTAYLALSMKKISAHTALDWGLVDEILS